MDKGTPMSPRLPAGFAHSQCLTNAAAWLEDPSIKQSTHLVGLPLRPLRLEGADLRCHHQVVLGHDTHDLQVGRM